MPGSVLVNSYSTDANAVMAQGQGVSVVPFDDRLGDSKMWQWTLSPLQSIPLDLIEDADGVVPRALWVENNFVPSRLNRR